MSKSVYKAAANFINVAELHVKVYCIDSLVQDCSNSSELAMELLQSCTKRSICPCYDDVMTSYSELLALCAVNSLESQDRGPVKHLVDGFFVVGLKSLLNKKLNYFSFEMLWHLCNITVMFIGY